jgi:arylsulfatase A
MMRFYLYLTLILFLPFVSRAYGESGTSRKHPNIVLILADDMGLGDLAFLNGGKSATPNLDQLAQTGNWFPNGYSASPVCAPARAALLTGRYPHRTNVVTLNIQRYPELTTLPPEELAIAEVLRGAGYRTGLIGKWHTSRRPVSHPLNVGFDVFEGFIGASEVPSYTDYTLEIQHEKRRFKDTYLTDDLTDRAISFVRRNRDQPFFLFLAHYAPHRPIGAPEDIVQAYMDRGIDRQTATVYAMIEVMDAGIGRLLETLDELGIRDDTIVVFSSDNGPDPLLEERFNIGLKGAKYDVFDGGVRVPFIFSWPRKVAPGERDEVFHFVDMFPTLAGLCGVPIPDGREIDGRSLAGYLLSGKQPEPVDYFWQWNRGAPNYTHNAALRRGTWKLVRPPVDRNEPEGDSPLAPVLYDLASDPGENVNVIEDHPGRGRAMLERLDQISRKVESDRSAVAGRQ